MPNQTAATNSFAYKDQSSIGPCDVVRQVKPSLKLVECLVTPSPCLPAQGRTGRCPADLQAALGRASLADVGGSEARVHAVMGVKSPGRQPLPVNILRQVAGVKGR